MGLIDDVWGDSEGFAQIVVGSYHDNRLKISSARFFEWPAEREAVAGFVQDRSENDVYFCTSLLSEKRRGRDFSTVTNAVYVDADTCSPDKFRLAPTVSVETSPGRYHCYWLLRDEVRATDASEAAHRICVAHRDEGCDPSGWVISKLLRVPGTLNTKSDPIRVVEIPSSGVSYSLAEILAAYDEVEVPSVLSVTKTELPDDLPDLIETVGLLDFDLLAMYRKTPSETDDWSRLRWRFSMDLFRAGYSAPQVFVLVKNTRYNKYERDSRPDQDLWTEITKAHEVAELERAQFVLDQFEDAGYDVQFLSAEERQLVSESESFIDHFEEWVATRSPLASHKYARFMAYMVLSLVYGSWVHITPKVGNMPPNLWGLLLGPSSELKKTTVVNLGLDLLRSWEFRLPEDQRGAHLGADFTAEGLNANLAKRDGLVSFVCRDEISGFFSEMFTKAYLSGGLERMTALYDGRVMRTLRAQANNSQQIDATTVFDFLGLGIESHTANALTLRHFQSGFLPRFLWCVDDAPVWTPDREILEAQDENEEHGADDALLSFCNQFSLARRKWDPSGSDGSQPIGISSDALARLNQFAVESKYLILGSQMEPVIEPSRVRMVWHIWKCASLLAVHDRADRIELPHILYVLREAESWFGDLVRMAEKVASSEFEGSVNEVETYIGSQSKAVPGSSIYRKFAALRKGEVDELLISLRSQGRVVVEEGLYSLPKET